MTRFNPLRYTTAALALAAVMAFTPGCDSGTDQTDPETEQADGDGDNHAAGHTHTLDPITIAGRTVTLTMSDIEPGKEAHIDVALDGDPVDAIRIWIGDEAGTDAIKTKLADATGGHAHADAPADLEGALIVVELEVDGETHTGTAHIPHHEEGEDHDDGDDGHGEHEEGDGHDDGHVDHDHDGDGVADH